MSDRSLAVSEDTLAIIEAIDRLTEEAAAVARSLSTLCDPGDVSGHDFTEMQHDAQFGGMGLRLYCGSCGVFRRSA